MSAVRPSARRRSAGGRRPPSPVGWDDPRTAERYERFCRRHSRYRDANAALVLHADLSADLRILDVGAGTGRTLDAVLERTTLTGPNRRNSPLPRRGPASRTPRARLLGPGRFRSEAVDSREDQSGTWSHAPVCVEPAAAMRAVGRRRHPQARWLARLPRRAGTFDRVLCGAALWQMGPIDRAAARLARLVAPGGALCFDVPAAYVGEPDEPGGGSDPWLLGLVAALAEGRPVRLGRPVRIVRADDVDAALRRAGLVPERWTFRRRVTQAEFRDWLRIPVLTDRLLAGLAPDERDRRIDRAWRRADPASWRWEAWTGWTARRPGAP